ncbi:MAG: TetR/AcrR family transcriptional regulator [Saprospiraceae bacterium]|nr:TetR/AcrR family transcriptional regulator [Saprospiraceae bacterium]
MLDSKEKIIHATIQLVYELGLENTATSKISKKAQVATGTLFHHYPNKKLLFEAVHQYILDEFVFQLMGFFDYPEDQIEQQLKKAIKASLEYWTRNPMFFSFMSQIMHSGYYSEVISRREDAYIDKQLGQAFQLAIRKGVVGKYEYKIVLRILLKTIFEISGMILHADTDEMKKKYRQHGINFIWAALTQK